MKKRLERYMPPGQDASGWLIATGIGLFFAFTYSLGFLGRFHDHLTGSNYSWRMDIVKMLTPEGFMPDFVLILQSSGIGFRLLTTLALFMTVGCYASFRNESKSIYLMKRLPDRREYWRRILVLPLLLLAFTLLMHLLLVLLYFQLYMHITPAELLQPMQWQKLWAEPWRILLCYY